MENVLCIQAERRADTQDRQTDRRIGSWAVECSRMVGCADRQPGRQTVTSLAAALMLWQQSNILATHFMVLAKYECIVERWQWRALQRWLWLPYTWSWSRSTRPHSKYARPQRLQPALGYANISNAGIIQNHRTNRQSMHASSNTFYAIFPPNRWGMSFTCQKIALLL